MKNIKEASNEYAKDYLFSPLPQRAPNVHFEEGANYVLEQITEAIRLCDNDRHTDLYKSLWNCIDELKK